MSNEHVLTPEEQYEAAALRLAIYRNIQEESKKLMESLSDEDREKADQFAKETYASSLRQAQKMLRRKNTGKNLRIILRPLVAVLLAVMILNFGLTIAAASSQTVRNQLVRFLLNINSSYATAGYESVDESIEVPSGWNESYYISYIPEGYHIDKQTRDNDVSFVEYRNQTGKKLSFQVCGLNSTTNVDAEAAKVTTEKIGESTATVIINSSQTSVIWQVGDRYIVVISTESEDLALAVAKSVALVKK